MELYETGNDTIWTNPHIREQLLKAHLDPDSDAASRKPETIEATVDWVLRGQSHPGSIIDLGCGPGLYAREYAARGWAVVGVDINESSINHAVATAKAEGLSIQYRRQSYLDKIDAGTFDVATCIYCDFGALTKDQQMTFLANARQLLAPNGVLVFDVFGPGISQALEAGRSWERDGADGFWSTSPAYVLSEYQHFEDEAVWGRKYIVLPDVGAPATYVVWDHYFTIARLEAMLTAAGFSVIETKSDLVPQSDFTSSDVLFVRARKTGTNHCP